MRPTLKDVAKLANVNFTLVSKYINRNPQARMTEETRLRIEAAIRELNYRPSASARALRSGRSRAVGLLSGDLTNAYRAHFADLMLRELQARGYQMLIALRGAGEEEALQSLLAREVDGVIVPETEESFRETPPCPVVVSGRRSARFSEVNPDLTLALEEALTQVSGKGIGLFFAHSLWEEEFVQAVRTLGIDAGCRRLSGDRETRRGEIRTACAARPDFIVTNGWETLNMLLEHLDDECPGYEPRLVVHANCTGPFLRDRRLAGAIHSSSSELVCELCDLLVRRIEQPGGEPERKLIPARYIPAGTPDYDALISRHFRLT